MTAGAYLDLCQLASKRGLHVELWTDYRARIARDPKLPVPRIDQLMVTTTDRRVLYRAPIGVRNINQVAACALDELTQSGAQ